jgi:uncharacterized protein YdeI (YjbR/CyaY-like superfamily)
MSSKPKIKSQNDIPVMLFKSQKDWTKWLEKNHAKSSGVWLQIAKKTGKVKTVSYAEALEVALCYGWIDGQGKGLDESAWLQKFTPRGLRSIWSKVNRTKAMELIESGRMQPAGLAAIDRAKKGGQWESAYDSHRTATVPADLQAALDHNTKAKAFFVTLDSTNRYAILFRLQTAKKAETRARRLERFVRMLENHEKLYS